MDINLDEVVGSMTKQDRIEARLYARFLKTKDGYLFMESLKRDIGWDTAGPSQEVIKTTNGPHTTIYPANSRDEWIGQRSVIFGIIQKALIGQKLIDTETE